MNSKEYWRKREADNLEKNLKTEEEYIKTINGYYDYTMDKVQKEINGFYAKYAKSEGITMAEAKKRVSKLDIESYERKAAKYVKDKVFSKEANEEMRIYNATMKINRLEMLKANIGLELVDGFDGLQKYFDEILTKRTLSELERQAGILGKTIHNNQQAAHSIVNASFSNATYSDRIWMYQDMMKAELSKLLQEGLIQGRNPRQLARHLTKLFGVSKYNSERLMRTELARVQIDAQKQSFERNGFDKYEFIALGSACGICKVLDGKYFDVKKMMSGENAPPIHPNCRCSVAAWEDNDEYEAWLDFLDKGGTTEEWNQSKQPLSLMKIMLPEDVHKINGITPDIKMQIENAINNLQKQYNINLDSVETGKMGRGDLFGSGPYIGKDGSMKFGLVINQNVDYNKVINNVRIRYDTGKFAGKSIDDYIVHEMAHIMTYQDCETREEYVSKKSVISKQFIKGISKYADKTEDGAESLAEAFVRYRNGEEIPLDAEMLVKEYIERWKK